VIRGKVSILHGHLDIGVAQDFLKGLQAPTSHHVPGGEVVPQVVEVEVIELGVCHGPVADFLNSTGAGNSPSVIEALALWQRGAFKLSAKEARDRMTTEKDPALRRLMAMLAARS
jgi:hypothetical protein